MAANPPDPALRPRRLFVSGGSELSTQAARLWHKLGRQLADEKGLVVITGGLESMKDSDKLPADKAFIDGFEERLRAQGMDPFDRIETFLPDRRYGFPGLSRFEKGRVRELTNRGSQARRYRMVFEADAMVSIEGGSGTGGVLEVALAINCPAFPVPCGGKKSAEIWKREKDEIRRIFRLSEDEIARLEGAQLGQLDDGGIAALASTIGLCLMRGIRKQCFVMMPFHKKFDPVFKDAIEPALAKLGFNPLRTDKKVQAGNIVEAIREGIRHCDIAIADISGDKPNVMYELGMAHAYGKPAVLLRRSSGVKFPPFDLRTECVIPYDDDLSALRQRLETAIKAISTVRGD